MPIQSGTTTRSAAAPPGINWNAILQAAKEGAAYGINEWLNSAKLDGGKLNAAVGLLTSGCFNSDLPALTPRINAVIEPVARREITNGDAAGISRAISRQVAQAWTGWAGSLWFVLPLGFPIAAAYPFAYMPPNPPTPPVPSIFLNMGLITGPDRLAKAYLAEQLLKALQEAGAMALGNAPPTMVRTGAVQQGVQAANTARVQGANVAAGTSGRPGSGAAAGSGRPTVLTTNNGSPQDLANNLAAYINAAFLTWQSTAYFTNIMGEGPVPTFAPPYVPVGPVIKGKIKGDLRFQAFG